MRRIERATKIRDLVLKEAGLTLEASLALGELPRSVCTADWQAKIRRVNRAVIAAPVIGAARIDLWVDGEKVAVIAWTADDMWVSHMRRGPWESEHFNQPPYRTPAERWLDICARTPDDHSVIAIMRQSRPMPSAGRAIEMALSD